MLNDTMEAFNESPLGRMSLRISVGFAVLNMSKLCHSGAVWIEREKSVFLFISNTRYWLCVGVIDKLIFTRLLSAKLEITYLAVLNGKPARS